MSTDQRYTECPCCPAVVPWLEMDEHVAWHGNRGDDGSAIPDRLRLIVGQTIEKFREPNMRDWHFTECAYCPGVMVAIDQLSEHMVWHRSRR